MTNRLSSRVPKQLGYQNDYYTKYISNNVLNKWCVQHQDRALKHGTPLLLEVEIDSQVQLYLQKVRQQGGVVLFRIAIAAARGVLMSTDKYKLGWVLIDTELIHC